MPVELKLNPTEPPQRWMRDFYSIIRRDERGILSVAAGRGGGKTHALLRLAAHIKLSPTTSVVVICCGVPARELIERGGSQCADVTFLDHADIERLRSMEAAVILVDEADRLSDEDISLIVSRIRQRRHGLMLGLFGNTHIKSRWFEDWTMRLELNRLTYPESTAS